MKSIYNNIISIMSAAAVIIGCGTAGCCWVGSETKFQDLSPAVSPVRGFFMELKMEMTMFENDFCSFPALAVSGAFAISIAAAIIIIISIIISVIIITPPGTAWSFSEISKVASPAGNKIPGRVF